MNDKQIMLQEKAEQEFKNTAKRQVLFENWAKTTSGSGLTELAQIEGMSKAHLVAQAMTNQERLMKSSRVQEETISTQFGVKPEMVLRVVKIGTANSNISRMFNEYQLTSTDDAIYYINPTYGRTKRGGTSGDIAYEKQNGYYGGESEIQSLGAGDDSAVEFTDTLSTKPVVPNHVVVLKAGVVVGEDDGSGIITGDLLNASAANTIVYSSGVVTVTFSAAPVTGEDVSIEYNWNSEDEDNFDEYGIMDISVTKDKFNARPEPLSYRISAMAEILLETSGLETNPINFLIEQAGMEHARMRDYRVIKRAKREALKNSITTFDMSFASVGEYSDASHAQRLWSVIKTVVKDVRIASQRGGVGCIIAGGGAVIQLQKSDKWVDDLTQPRFGCFLAGRIGGIEVFECPANAGTHSAGIADNEILVTIRGNSDAGDIDIAVGFLREIRAQLTYPHFNTEGSLAIISDTKVINSSFLRLVRLTNITF